MDETIRQVLGDRAKSFRYRVAGVERVGWRAPVGSDASAPDEGVDEDSAVDPAERRVDEMRRALRDGDVRVFLGDGGRTVYALPGLPAADVIEVMKVGTHNGGAEPHEVRSVVASVGVPFDVAFADAAGLEIVFGAKLSTGQARALIESILAHDWLDSYALMAEEGCEVESERELDSEEHAEAMTFVLHTNGLRLWWD
jgi:hypothetical protein